jgi:hypothetical protein
MLLIPIITLLTFCLKNIIRLLKVAIHIPTGHFFFLWMKYYFDIPSVIELKPIMKSI